MSRIIVIDNDHDTIYGPYSDEEADRIGKEMRENIDAVSKSCGNTKPISITSYPLYEWTKDVVKERPPLPDCHVCNKPMHVWDSVIGEETYAECQNCNDGNRYELSIINDQYINMTRLVSEFDSLFTGPRENEQVCYQERGFGMGILSLWWKRWTKGK